MTDKRLLAWGNLSNAAKAYAALGDAAKAWGAVEQPQRVATDELETLRQVIAGEPARTAAAVAAAREEQREACALHVVAVNPEAYTAGEYAEDVRTTPLTATPLAERAERAEAERDAMQKRLAVELVDVSMERTWCRECRTEDCSRKRDRATHPHAKSCSLYSEG